MAFIAKNPIVSPQTNSPPLPPPNTRGIFPKDDGWYEIDDNGNVRKLINRSSKSVPNDISAVTEIIRCATSYLNHKTDFTFTDSGKGTLFDDDFSADSPKIDCSSAMMAWVMGIPYEYSKYAGKNNSKHYEYGIKLPTNPYATGRPNRYYTHELAHYFDDQGWCFVPDKNYSDIAPGDIIFVSFKSRDGNSDFHDNAYMKIDHCLLVIGYKDPTHLICLHTSNTYTLNYYDVCVLPSDYDSTSKNSYNSGIKLVARLPFKAANNISKEPIFIDSKSFTTTNTTNGFLRTITLDEPLKINTAYTLAASVENAFTQTKPSTNNYFGVRVSYADGTADETILSWAKNVYPEDNLYRCHFVTGDKAITKLKLYILACTVAGHKYNYSVLYEGFVSTTPTDDDISNGVSIKESISNKVTTLDSDSTDTQYPSAKCAYDELNKKANMQNLSGGFNGGLNTVAYDGGGAIGNGAMAWSGGAVGRGAVVFDGGGGAVGTGAMTVGGGAVGNGAESWDGFAGGKDAKTKIGSSTIDAIQLGAGTNPNVKTLQIYDYQLMDADGHIPNDRIPTKADKTTVSASTEATPSITLSDNTEARCGELTSLTVTLPETLSDSFISSVVFKSGTTATTVTVPSDVYCQGADCKNGAFLPKANKRYTMIFSYDGIMNCYIAAVPIQTSETQSEDVTEDEVTVADNETAAETSESAEEETEPNEVI